MKKLILFTLLMSIVLLSVGCAVDGYLVSKSSAGDGICLVGIHRKGEIRYYRVNKSCNALPPADGTHKCSVTGSGGSSISCN